MNHLNHKNISWKKATQYFSLKYKDLVFGIRPNGSIGKSWKLYVKFGDNDLIIGNKNNI